MKIAPGCKYIVSLAAVWLPAGGIVGCGSADAPSGRYYYPIAELHQGLAYVYEGVGDAPAPTHYWYFRSVQTPDSTMLVSTYYDADFQPRQLLNERIVGLGSLLRDLRLYLPTAAESTVTEAEILQPALFSFEPPDTDRLLVSAVRFTEPSSPSSNQPARGGSDSLEGFRQNPPRATYTLTRNRTYRSDTSYVFGGRTLPAQLWTVRELTEQDSVGTLAIESAAIEIYAEGIGLVYRERRFANGRGEAHRLRERLPMDSLVARFGKSLGR